MKLPDSRGLDTPKRVLRPTIASWHGEARYHKRKLTRCAKMLARLDFQTSSCEACSMVPMALLENFVPNMQKAVMPEKIRLDYCGRLAYRYLAGSC